MFPITDPNIALVLLFIGALGIYAEFCAPGMVAPGVAGAILTLLGFTALCLFPLNWTGAALMLAALGCFALEAKFATHGILTAAGAIAMVRGAMTLIDTGGPGTNPEIRIHLSTALAVTLPFALITTFLLSLAVRARRNKTLMGLDAMVGQAGVAVGELNPRGTVMVRGEYWGAVAPTRVGAAAPVRVKAVTGFTLRVEPLD